MSPDQKEKLQRIGWSCY